jgi:predicted nucleotide-binding protein
MNLVDELRIHVDALASAIEQNPKFFASIKHYVKQLRQLVRAPREQVSQSEIEILAKKIEEFFDKWRPGESSSGVLYLPPRETSDSDPTVTEINTLVAKLAAMDENSFKELFPSLQPEIEKSETATDLAPCVFIGHGRSKLWARLKVYLEDELNLATITYESESHVGESIVPVLEKMLEQGSFAVLVLTAEDKTSEGSKRARQNVIHEAGLFQGRLGFKKAVLLRQDGLEGLTNVDGLQYIGFSGDSIEQTFYELQRVLKREGLLK